MVFIRLGTAVLFILSKEMSAKQNAKPQWRYDKQNPGNITNIVVLSANSNYRELKSCFVFEKPSKTSPTQAGCIHKLHLNTTLKENPVILYSQLVKSVEG